MIDKKIFKEMKLHKYCELIPEMSPDEFSMLKADIAKNGLLSPIVVFDNQVLDGRHRFKACDELGIEPETIEYKGNDPLGYALSLNQVRRHLNQSQKAMLAANVATLKIGEVGNGRVGPSNDGPTLTTKKIAKTFDISTASVERAKKLKRTAPKQVTDVVEAGRLSVNAAQKVVNNTKPELLSKATPAQIEDLSKAVNESVVNRIERIVDIANKLRHEYDALSSYEQTDEVLGAFSDVHLQLELIAQIRINKQKSSIDTLSGESISPKYDGKTPLRPAIAKLVGCSPKSTSLLSDVMARAKKKLKIKTKMKRMPEILNLQVYEHICLNLDDYKTLPQGKSCKQTSSL